MPKVSVILPAYNAASSIRRMMDSLLCQTLKDIEILAVDDGSTDETGSILDNYASHDARVRVFHQSNSGVALSRKVGVENACGEYSIHADADDWVDAAMLEKMYNHAKTHDADVVICDYYRLTLLPPQTIADCHLAPHEVCSVQNPTSYHPHQILDDILRGRLFGALWNKMIRHSLYRECDAKFYKGINYCEDVLILLQMLRNEKIKVAGLHRAYYHYVENPQSITHGGSMASYKSTLLFAEKALNHMPDTQQFVYHRKHLPFYYFMLAFNANAIPPGELQREYRKVRDFAYASSGMRWRLGFLCLDLRLPSVAHKLLSFNK